MDRKVDDNLKKKICITGGAGFIGTHLAGRLIKDNIVFLFDNYRRDSLTGLEIENHPNCTIINGDITNKQEVSKAIQGVDIVIHLAAIAGVSSYYSIPYDTLQVNIGGTINVLDAVVESDVKKLIYFSSSEVYGQIAKNVKEEDILSIGPVSDKRWVYATSKLAGENLVLRCGEKHNFHATCIRPFNIYGPRQTGEGAISNFFNAACKKEPLQVYGDGEAIRAWCYISDLVDSIELILCNDISRGHTFNIGNDSAIESSNSLAKKIALLYSNIDIYHKSIDRTEVIIRIPNINKARSLLGFSPKVTMDEGLNFTSHWFWSQYL